MSERAILKIFVFYLLIGYLATNTMCAYALSEDAGSSLNENKTESSEYAQKETSKYVEPNSSKDIQNYNSRDTTKESSNYTEANSSENTLKSSQNTKGESSGFQIEGSEHNQIKNPENIQIKKPIQSTDLPKNSKPAPPSASVSLHGEKTDVVPGEDILLRLSAVNLITKPPMHVQVIIIPPSGMSVSSSEFVQSGAGQYTTTYDLDPGQGRDIEVRIETNQPGNFNVQGRVVYYFGKDIKNAEDYTLNLPIEVEAKSYIADKTIPGFTLASLISVLIIVLISRRN